MDSGHTRVATHPSPSSECLKSAFSGSTSYPQVVANAIVAGPDSARNAQNPSSRSGVGDISTLLAANSADSSPGF
jgi:hypothetical protein